MKPHFHVRVLRFSTLREIDGAWTSDDFSALLDAMEYGDQAGLAGDDLRQMCLMSLQDQTPEHAAYLVLRHVLGGILREGQLKNMANEMVDEKLWEEYVDPALHERLFNVGSLLFQAMPRTFPKPDAARVELEITAEDEAAQALLTPSTDEAFLVRLLGDGMDKHAVLHRMYGEQLAGDAFPNADQIVWIVRAEMRGDDKMAVEVISSGYWLDPLAGTRSYASTAHADKRRERSGA